MTASMQYAKDLSALNTLATPAVAEVYCEVHDAEELEEALAHARKQQLTVTVLGEGSNVVLGDTIPGLVVHVRSTGREVLREDAAGATLGIAAGENWHSLVQWCLQQGYHGLENLALIPGTVGAAPIQNIGAYGVEVGRFITEVRCRDTLSGERIDLQQEACQFAYRDSIFKGELRERTVVEQVILCLPKQPAPVLTYPSLADYLHQRHITAAGPREVFDAVVAIRSARLPDPGVVPNAGSFFKNPVLDTRSLEDLQDRIPKVPHYEKRPGQHTVPAAYLIAACAPDAGLGVSLHPEHALVIVNPGRCSAGEIRRFARRVVDAVQQRFNILLEQEPRDYG